MLRRIIRPPADTSEPFNPPDLRRERRREDEKPERVPRPRRGLPDSRAVVGGLLVACAVLGTWWTTVDAGSTTPTRYVVAVRPIAPGALIEPADLQLAPMALAPSVAASAFTDVDALIGTVALGPIGRGGLVQAPGVAPSTGTRTGREMSFAVATPWAVDGALRAGDRIDVFVTAADGIDGEARKVLSSAVVRHLSTTGGGLGEATGLTITVAVRDSADLDGAVGALRSADITVVRATGATGASSATGTDSTPSEGAPVTDRGDPMPRSTSTTAPARSPRPSRPVTTTTVRPGAGR